MDDSSTDRQPEAVQVTLGSSQYSLVEGGSVDVEILLANPGPSDFFIVNILGIPPGWIQYSGPSAVWVATGEQEKYKLTVRPPATAEGIAGSYPGRLYVFRQSSPDKGKEFPISVVVHPPETAKKSFALSVDSKEIAAAPGARIKIPLMVKNTSPKTEFVEISVQGVPVSWLSTPSPVITLQGGEDKIAELYLQIPATPETRPGKYPLKIFAFSQQAPENKEAVEINLSIAAFESQGPVGVMLDSVQYSVTPGDSATIPLTVINRGLEAATFRLGVEGIPVGWVSTSNPITSLQPGESREISLVIRPPLSSASPAGRNKFRVVVRTQESPDQIVKVDCILTVAAYTQFTAVLDPDEVEAGKPVRVVVTNEGNTLQVYKLVCESDGNKLIFEYLEPEGVQLPGGPPGSAPETPSVAANPAGDLMVIQIKAGEIAAFRFTARPRNRPWIGGMDIYPYQAIVEADHKKSPALPGEVKGRGLIPTWILAIFLILCLWGCFSATFSLFGSRFQANSATQTAVAGTAQVVGATQTIVANQTAAAAAGQQDTDGDGLINQRETEIGSDPNNADTDRDGLLDGEEVFRTGTNALLPDTDADGLLDGDEFRRGTNPLNPDTDADTSRDGDEVRLGTDPLKGDTDGDGLLDGSENQSCPHALNPDTDQDGLIDGRDLDPCNTNNPAMTATGIASQPTATNTLPAPVIPTQTPTLPPVVPTVPQLPSFPGLILIESSRDGNPEIYALDSSGQTRRMTNSPAADVQGVWDPSMRRIAFTSNRDGQNEIYLINADGSNPVNLTNNPADDQQPSWSSDGAFLLFTSNRDGNYEIYALQVNNLSTRNLTNSPSNDTQPGWIRSLTRDLSGDYILFTSNRDGNQEIYRMKSDGSGTLNLTMNPANDQLAKGSPDGALVAFTSDRTGNQEIFTMQLDGQGLTNLTNNPSSDFGSAWAPDQAWIAFTTDRNGNREGYILRPGQSELYDVTNNPSQDQVTDWK